MWILYFDLQHESSSSWWLFFCVWRCVVFFLFWQLKVFVSTLKRSYELSNSWLLFSLLEFTSSVRHGTSLSVKDGTSSSVQTKTLRADERDTRWLHNFGVFFWSVIEISRNLLNCAKVFCFWQWWSTRFVCRFEQQESWGLGRINFQTRMQRLTWLIQSWRLEAICGSASRPVDPWSLWKRHRMLLSQLSRSIWSWWSYTVIINWRLIAGFFLSHFPPENLEHIHPMLYLH